jgi:isopenicillin N synthase-like dioxygenase
MLDIINIADLRSPEFSTRQACAHKILHACHKQGFFYAVGHGLEMRRSFELSRAFFALPAAEKEKISILHSAILRGYEPPNSQDSKEAFVMGAEKEIKKEIPQSKWDGLNQWPETLDSNWQKHFSALYSQMLDIAKLLNRGLALGLQAPEDYFDRRSDDPMAALRLLHYSPNQDLVGIAPHTDWGAMSLIFQEDVAGLEVFTRDGQWLEIPPLAGACVANVGNLIGRWTNDLIQPTLHRVVNKTPHDRYSIAFFLDMNHDAVIEPVPSCVTAERPLRYAPITVEDYLAEMHRQDYAHVV